MILKRTLPFFILFAFIATFQSKAQDINVSISKNPISVGSLTQEIEKQTSYLVVFSNNDVDTNRMVNLPKTTDKLSAILKAAFDGTNIDCKIDNGYVILTKKKSNTDEKTVSGIISNEKGTPIPGVYVLVKNSNPPKGNSSDIDGKFSIPQVKSSDILVFQFIGMKSTEETVGARITINVTMHEDVLSVGELVVTALGIKRSEKSLSYNVQEVKSEELTNVKDANFVNSLSGKVAGVNINASSAGAGGATRVVMRGVKSISANNNALYVVDGVPIFNTNGGSTSGEYSQQPRGEGISDLNPEDIASMSVLSGAAAAALYGSNAAQGVILITTKKGMEGKAKVTVSSNVTFSTPFVMPEFQKTYGNRPGEFKSWGAKLESPSNFDPKDFYNTGTNIQNTVSLSVGDQKNQTYLSVGTTNSTGLISNSLYDRYNFTFRNTTSFLNKKMILDVGASYIIQNDKNLMAQGQYFNPILGVYLYPRGENFDDVRLYERYDEGRQIYIQHWSWGTQGLDMQNPYWLMYRNIYGTKKNRYMLNASLKYNIADWINVVGRIRVDNANSDYQVKRYASTAELFAGPKGFYRFDKTIEKQTYGDIITNINKTFGDFSLNANIGGSGTYINSDMAGFQGALKDMPNLFTYFNIDFKTGHDSYPLQEGWEETTLSLFANAEIGWKNKLFITLTGRNDWASALAETKDKNFFYPSVGISAVISDMVKLPQQISYLKLRGSWANVGSAIPRGLSQPRYKWNQNTGKWETNTFRPIGVLKPERTNSYEFGLTTKFFHNKIIFDFTMYKSNTKNQTFKIPISPSGGYNSMYVQSGNVENKGLELSLGLSNDFGNLKWNSTLTYSMNKNKVIELLNNYKDPISGETYTLTQSGQGGIGSVEYILKKGGTMGDIYVKTDLKRDQEGNVWIDPNKHTVVVETLTTPKKLGSVLPKANMGFRNDFTYKNFNFGFMLAARLGGVVVSPTQSILDEYGVSKSTEKMRNNGGILINKGKVDAEKYYDAIGGKQGLMSQYTYKATNIRLQEAYIGYTLPAKWFNNKLRVTCSVNGRNLLMIYNKAPFDPESTASTGTYFQGIDYFMQPSLKNYGFNIKIQF